MYSYEVVESARRVSWLPTVSTWQKKLRVRDNYKDQREQLSHNNDGYVMNDIFTLVHLVRV